MKSPLCAPAAPRCRPGSSCSKDSAQRCAMTHQHTCWFQLRVEFWPLGMWARMHAQARTAQMWGGFKCKIEISGHSCNFASLKTASNVISKMTRTEADTSHNLITCRNYLWSPGLIPYGCLKIQIWWSRYCTMLISFFSFFSSLYQETNEFFTIKKCVLCEARFATLLTL